LFKGFVNPAVIQQFSELGFASALILIKKRNNRTVEKWKKYFALERLANTLYKSAHSTGMRLNTCLKKGKSSLKLQYSVSIKKIHKHVE
jgi:hypothetical protein